MVPHPEYHVAGEILRILRAGPAGTEVLVRITGRRFDPEDPATFVHLRAHDARDRVLGRGRSPGAPVTGLRFPPGAPVTGLVCMTTRWLEESEVPRRTLEVNGRRGSGRLPRAIRVVGYDFVVAGEVVRDLDPDAFILDAGIPVLVHTPDFPPSAHPVGGHVEFLLHHPTEIHIV